MDMARIGQFLLNKGSYGNKVFLSENVFEQMLPGTLYKTLGRNVHDEYGIGTSWFKGEGLGKGTFGHGAGSGATLRISPEFDLVISMTRNAGGKDFDKYHSVFIKEILDSIEK